jgi:hypothetical protein
MQMTTTATTTSVEFLEAINRVVERFLYRKQVITRGMPELAVLPSSKKTEHEAFIIALRMANVTTAGKTVADIMDTLAEEKLLEHSNPIFNKACLQWKKYRATVWAANYDIAKREGDMDRHWFERTLSGLYFDDLFVDDDHDVNPLWARVPRGERRHIGYDLLVSNKTLSTYTITDNMLAKRLDSSSRRYAVSFDRSLRPTSVATSAAVPTGMRAVEMELSALVKGWASEYKQNAKVFAYRSIYGSHINPVFTMMRARFSALSEEIDRCMTGDKSSPEIAKAGKRYHLSLGSEGELASYTRSLYTTFCTWRSGLHEQVSLLPMDNILHVAGALFRKLLAQIPKESSREATRRALDEDSPRWLLANGFKQWCTNTAMAECKQVAKENRETIKASLKSFVGMYSSDMTRVLSMTDKFYSHYDTEMDRLTTLYNTGENSEKQRAMHAFTNTMAGCAADDMAVNQYDLLENLVAFVDSLEKKRSEDAKAKESQPAASLLSRLISPVLPSTDPLFDQHTNATIRSHLLGILGMKFAEESIQCRHYSNFVGCLFAKDYPTAVIDLQYVRDRRAIVDAVGVYATATKRVESQILEDIKAVEAVGGRKSPKRVVDFSSEYGSWTEEANVYMCLGNVKLFLSRKIDLCKAKVGETSYIVTDAVVCCQTLDESPAVPMGTLITLKDALDVMGPLYHMICFTEMLNLT